MLPDTQYYSEKFPEIYKAQTTWIAEQRKARNIAAVLHLGDITNQNTPAQWKNAGRGDESARRREGAVFLLPRQPRLQRRRRVQGTRTTGLNGTFPVARYKNLPTFGGTYDKEPGKMENSFGLFRAGGRDFLVLALEFGAAGRRDPLGERGRRQARTTARRSSLPMRIFILTKPGYDWQKFGAKQNWNPHAYAVAKATKDDVADGQELWDGLVSKHENFILTLNGHVLGDGLGRVTTPTPDGRAVPQVLVNFQMRPEGRRRLAAAAGVQGRRQDRRGRRLFVDAEAAERVAAK